MSLVLPLALSGLGVAVAALAFSHRDDPTWQRGLPALIVLAVGQVLLGAITWILLRG